MIKNGHIKGERKMLITKGISPGEIVGFKMVTGEELVAKLVEETADAWLVSKPLMVYQTDAGIGFIQPMLSSTMEKSFTLKKIHVTLESEIVEPLKKHYLSTTSSILT